MANPLVPHVVVGKFMHSSNAKAMPDPYKVILLYFFGQKESR